MKKEKYFDFNEIKQNQITLKQLKRLNDNIPISEEEVIISRVGINSEYIQEPARLESCQHIEVIEYENLKKFIINHGFCPLCQTVGNVEQIFIDSFLKNLFNLVRYNSNNYLIIDFNKLIWRIGYEGSKYTKFTFDNLVNEKENKDSNKKYLDFDFLEIYDILNKDYDFSNDRIFLIEKSFIEIPKND